MRKFLAALAILLACSCYSDNKEDVYENYPQLSCDLTNVTYCGTVKTILIYNCASSSCHDATTRQAGLDLGTYQDAASIANDGRLLGHVTGQQLPQMPPDNPLAQCDIRKLTEWVDDGAPNN